MGDTRTGDLGNRKERIREKEEEEGRKREGINRRKRRVTLKRKKCRQTGRDRLRG